MPAKHNIRIANPLKSWVPADIPELIRDFGIRKGFFYEEDFNDPESEAIIRELEEKPHIEDSNLDEAHPDDFEARLARYVLMKQAAELGRQGDSHKLSDVDRDAMDKEHSLFHQSRSFYLAISMVSLAATCQGWGMVTK